MQLELLAIAVGFSCCAMIFTVVTAIFSFMAYSRVVGMEKSTHQVSWMPLDPQNPSKTGDDMMKDMSKAFGYEDNENDQI